MEKVEGFLKRLRWKAHFFEKSAENDNEGTDSNFGFKSNKTPPQNEHLNAFEDDLYNLMRGIEFKDSNLMNAFQRKLKNDVKEISESTELFVSADKTTNLYKMSKEAYEKLLHDNVTKTYKKANDRVQKEINKEAKDIATQLKLQDKIECFADRNAFVTLKDHKENFRSNPKCRLINPAKSDIGKISKKIIQRVNNDIRNHCHPNQWKNTDEVISWFKSIPDKSKCKFMKFDIVEFYPSISENLLKKALEFAKSISSLTEEEINIIWHARKSLLFSKDEVWIKKGDHELFDVTMGSWDGAEVCDLIGLFMLHEAEPRFGKEDIGVYRDDGLASLQNHSGPLADRARKDLVQLFKSHGLSITVETNLTCTDFLDVTFDLQTAKYFPFRKPNDTPLYVNYNSNHPATIKKELPSMIEKRLSELSCDEVEFNKAKPIYQDALTRSGYSTELHYKNEPKNRKSRRRKIIWFNPPFSQSVRTNVGKEFMKLVDKHFPRHHKFSKIFNRNTIKVSYSCMDNMESMIRKHNAKILNPTPEDTGNMCSCRKKDCCPLNGKCLKKEIIYKATVSSEGDSKIYFGLTATDFKTRYNNHTNSFRQKEKSNSSELSKHIWHLKDNSKQYSISWSIAATATPYICGSGRCNLCLTEKVIIVQADPANLLNKRTELISKCRHQNKFLIKSVKD